MRLVQRLNYILLPIICLVFVLAGTITFYAFVEQAKGELGRDWAKQLTFTGQELALEQQNLRSYVNSILNSPTTVNFLLAEESPYRRYSIEQQLFSSVLNSKHNGHGINQLQLLGSDGSIWLSADQQSPFGERQLLPLPQQLSERAQQALFEQRYLAPIEAIVADPEHNYALALQFNPAHPDNHDHHHNHGNFAILLSAKLTSIASLKQDLQQQLGQHFELTLRSPNSSDATGVSQIQQPGRVILQLNQPLYQLQLAIHYDVLTPQLKQIFTRILLLVIALITTCFLCQRWLLQSKIVRPINHLVERIERTGRTGSATLMPMSGQNEVAKLNNAYVGLMEQMQQLATYDPLTGLANRHSFQQWFTRLLQRQNQHKPQPLALLYIDLDNFKRVNDQHGHASGDQLLRQFAEQLRRTLRPSDMISSLQGDDAKMARLAGDEFAVVLSDIKQPSDVAVVAERINQIFVNGFKVDQMRHNVQASIGIAIYPEDGQDADTLMAHADAAMYQAKELGKNRYRFFSSEIAAKLQRKQHIEQTLSDALQRNELLLNFMPICASDSLAIEGVEALLRCPALGAQGIGPDQFIPVAEATGQIHQLDLWVLDKALNYLSLLQAKQHYQGIMAVNISAVELHNSQFPEQVKALLRRYHIEPHKLELEITETSLIADDDDTQQVLNQLKELGVRLSLDDFGTGYTAFRQLASYPVDILKIDRSFVNRLAGKQTDETSMLEIMLELARLYQLQVVAEGVETQAQLDYLRDNGCQQVQGYFIGKPMTFDKLQQRLEQI